MGDESDGDGEGPLGSLDAGPWFVGLLQEGDMDILVMLEETPDASPVLAHVNSVPQPLQLERPTRDVVTLYGVANAESLALALAAAVESHRAGEANPDTIRHLGIWPERGAVGDAAWRDAATGELVTRDLDIPVEILTATAGRLLRECGQVIQRLAAGLSMPDWPEGARRAISFSLSPVFAASAVGSARMDARLDTFREADGLAWDEGD